MSGKKWKLRQDGRMHYTLLEDADVPANVHTPPIAFLSFVEQQHRDLIVAAPEMLEALEKLTEAMLQAMIEENWGKGMYDGVLRGEAFRTSQSIIAKAKGVQP